MKYLVKKDDLYLYKVKPNGYGYFSTKEHATAFSKEKAKELAKMYKGEIVYEINL